MSTSSTIDLVSAIAGFGVFVGTAALALVTFRSSKDARAMVEETKRLADATARQADVNRQALDADARPWLSPPRDREEPGSWLVEVVGYSTGYAVVRLMLENVGRGIALLPPDGIRFLGHLGGGPLTEVGTGTAESSVISPGRICAFEFHTNLGTTITQITGPPKFVVESGRIAVEVLYRDAASGNGAVIELIVGRSNRGELWRVLEVRYLREDDRSLIAEVTPPRATRILSEREMDESTP